MDEIEGICDDCQSQMVARGKDVWRCDFCECYSLWEGGWYVYLQDEEAEAILNEV
ncbi:MAG: hypothetical protein KAJ03_04240 [Gammaproteobacteria bacterium]|nr:hypothetical protein [Gammaproteobacteria bacterium]